MLRLVYLLFILFILLEIITIFIALAKFVGKFKKVSYDKLLFSIGLVFNYIVITELVILIQIMHMRLNPYPDSLIADWHPYPDMLSFVLNCIIPLVVVMLFLIALKAKNELTRAAGIIGITLSLVSLLGAIFLGHYVFTEFFGESLKSALWWF